MLYWNDGLCIENDDFNANVQGELPCENYELCIKNEKVCIKKTRKREIVFQENTKRGNLYWKMMNYAGAPLQVSFQWKNPDFLLKNPDFLMWNPDFLLENVDFIIK